MDWLDAMPKIQNIDIQDLVRGRYAISAPERTELIRILNDHGELDAHVPATAFLRTHVFVFLDIGDPPRISPLSAPFESAEREDYGRAITPPQARALVDILERALHAGHDLVVHCTAGVSRSGAVVEAAVRMGFEDPGTFRAPNARVLRLLLDAAEKSPISAPPWPRCRKSVWLRRALRLNKNKVL